MRFFGLMGTFVKDLSQSQTNLRDLPSIYAFSFLVLSRLEFMFSTKKIPPQWQSDSLLNGKPQNPNFIRTHWDESKAKDFGPWRLDSDSHPTDGLNKEHAPKHDTQGESVVEKENTDAEAQHNLVDPPSDQVESSSVEDHPSSTKGLKVEENKALSRQSVTAQSSIQKSPIDHNIKSDQTDAYEQQTRIARQQGYVQGLRDGMAKTLLDLDAERKKERELIENLTNELSNFLKDSSRHFEPLKKLSLHIAEQLVRGELSLSGHAIERLIKMCLSELSVQDKFITISANPHDLERVSPLLKEVGSKFNLHPDNNLLPGSIRIKSNDTIINDLIETRLEGIARQLIEEPESWIKNSSFLVGAKVEALNSSPLPLQKSSHDHDIDDVEEKSSLVDDI